MNNWLERISPKVRHCGCAPFVRGIINPWRVISDHEYFIFEKGSGYLVIDGRRHECPESSYIIIPCGRRHISYSVSGSVLLHWGHFDWEPFDDSVPSDVFMEPRLPGNAKFREAPEYVPREVMSGGINDKLVFILSQRLIKMLRSPSSMDRALARPTLHELLIRMLSPSMASETGSSANSRENAAELVRQLLTAAAHKPSDSLPNMETLISSQGFSYSRQQRLFRETFGITPHQYLTLLRVERIKELFKDGTLTLGQIADTLGFKDQAYFSRYVKKHLGASPGKAKNANR